MMEDLIVTRTHFPYRLNVLRLLVGVLLLTVQSHIDTRMQNNNYSLTQHHIDGVMLASSAVDCGFEPRSVQNKDYEIGICCFFTKHAALMRESKDLWLGIRLMCQNVTTCLSADCCFSELAL